MRPPAHTPPRPTIYPSGVDLWIALLIVFAPILSASIGVFLLMEGKQDDAMALFATALLTAAMMAAFTVPCRYTINQDTLAVRCGIIGYRIPLDQIERVETSRTWLSGPALSMRRVKVTTKKRCHILSPREREEFMADLEQAVAQCKPVDSATT